VSQDNLVVVYHYVRPQNSDGVTGLAPEAFRRQLGLVGSRYRFVTVEEYVATCLEQNGMALVTFDDAVSDQYVYAFPILESLGIPCVVFAPMRPFADVADRWCTQHLLHALASHLSWREFERRVDRILGEVAVDEDAMNRLYHYEVPEKRRLKYLMAFTLSQEDARAVLEQINATEGLHAEDWFVTGDQLREMQSAGHAIGGHGFDHVPYNTLTPKDQAADMHRAQETMTKVCGAMARPLAYPYGRSTPETETIARGCGYTHCFDADGRVDAKYLEGHLGESR
jgi:peptidoglycan/xylan/chitin deacetylase (PgdA/CDA1 family)